MRNRCGAIALGAVLALLAHRSDAQSPSRRFPADTFWRRVWIAGDKNDGTFVEPRVVIVHGDRVTVLDRGTREVHSFDRRSGRALLRMTARGSGPGEFKRPTNLIAAGDGFGVVDQGNARLTTFDPQGRRRWDTIIPDLFRVSDFCLVAPSRIMLHYRRRDSSVVVIDSVGRRVSVQSIPWSVPRPTPMPFAHEAYFSRASDDRTCVLVPYFGGEWAVVPGEGVPGLRASVRPFIERGEEPVMLRNETPIRLREGSAAELKKAEETATQPTLTDAPPIAKGVLLRGDTVIVIGARTKQDPHRLVDYYERRSGRYLYSRRLPFTFVSLAVDHDGTFFGTLIEENLQALVAFRPERLTKTVQRELERTRTKATAPSTRLSRDTAVRRSPPAPGHQPTPP